MKAIFLPLLASVASVLEWALGLIKKGNEGRTEGSLEGKLDAILKGQQALKRGQRALKHGQQTLKQGQDELEVGQRKLASAYHKLDERFQHVAGFLSLTLKEHFKPPPSGQESRGTNQGFRKKVIEYYGIQHDQGRQMKCMVLGFMLPEKFLVAGHLFARRWRTYAQHTVGVDFDIDSPKNGLLWNSAIESAYEQQRICFSYCSFKEEYTLHVVDKTLLPEKLKAVGQHKSDVGFAAAVGDTTFGDLNGRLVCFSGKGKNRPCKRALSLHAMLALENCKDKYPETFDHKVYVFDYMSDNPAKQAFLDAWLNGLQRLDVQPVVEEGGASEQSVEGQEEEGEKEEEEMEEESEKEEMEEESEEEEDEEKED